MSVGKSIMTNRGKMIEEISATWRLFSSVNLEKNMMKAVTPFPVNDNKMTTNYIRVYLILTKFLLYIILVS